VPIVTQPRTRIRLKVLAALVVFMFAALTTRLWFLQVLASTQFQSQANRNQVQLVPIEPIRGDILDRNGVVLATNTSTLEVFVDRQQLPADTADAEIQHLAHVLGLPAQRIQGELKSLRYPPYLAVPVATGVAQETAYYLGEHQSEFPGVSFRPIPIRNYPRGTLAAHVVGYEYQITPDELTSPEFAGYQPGDVIGQAGIESSYESYLRGKPGTQAIQVNASGTVIDPDFREVSPTHGDDVILSIDSKIQRLAEQSLALGIHAARGAVDTTTNLHFKAPAGAAIVMDPKTGQVLAIASNPSFDPSIYVNGPTAAERAALNDPAANQPLLDRAISGLYPPGSTFKPFIATAALHDHFAGLNQGFKCPANYLPPGDTTDRPFRNWNPVDSGSMSLAQALVVSCDTVFYPFGWDYYVHWIRSNSNYDARDQLLQRDLLQMGFGRRTGIDLGGESVGVVPTSQYKKAVNARLKKLYGNKFTSYPWFPGDYINMSIGQGFTLVTPLQMAVAYSAIANGGKVLVPHVAWKIETPEGKLVKNIAPTVVGHLPATAQQLAYIRAALTGVPVSGTATAAFAGFPLSKIPVAGKTGTAQIQGKQDTSWFCAMAPANNPRYVVAVVIEEGGHGATSAAPVVRRILEGLFGLPISNLLNTSSRAD
jgi:penicillin-binding protein 2